MRVSDEVASTVPESERMPALNDKENPLDVPVDLAGFGKPFLEALTIDYGPLQLLGQYFAATDAFLQDLGISLRLASLEAALRIHERHTDSWHSYPPMLNPRVVRVDEAQSFSIICLDRTDAPVAVIAGRIYGDTGTLAESISRQNFIYGHGVPAPAGPRLESWAQNLHEVKAPFSYIGALWVHPNSRGLKLARLLPPLTRGYALAKWNIKFDVGLASDDMVRKGMAEVYGYTRVESGFRAYGLG